MSLEPSQQPITEIGRNTNRFQLPTGSDGLLSEIASTLARFRRNYFARSSFAVVLGAGQQAEQVRQNAEGKSALEKLQIRGFIPLNNETTCVPQHLVFHSNDLTALLRESGSNVLIIAPDGQLRYPEIQQILDCKLRGVKMICASGNPSG